MTSDRFYYKLCVRFLRAHGITESVIGCWYENILNSDLSFQEKLISLSFVDDINSFLSYDIHNKPDIYDWYALNYFIKNIYVYFINLYPLIRTLQ
jgi:hypothetical protein